jgi:hypothetical protein
MNDGDMLENLGVHLGPEFGRAPAHVRERVIEGVAGTPPMPRRRHSRRIVWRFAAAGGLAIAVTSAVLVAQVVPFGESLPTSSAEVADVLNRAARTALIAPSAEPRSSQMVFIEYRSWSPVLALNPGDPTTQVSLYRVWRSVDGSRDGVIWSDPPEPNGKSEHPIPGCRDGKASAWASDGTLMPDVKRPCTPEPGYLSNLPTGVTRMREWLYKTADAEAKGSRDQAAFAGIGPLMLKGDMQPAARAALFEAAAHIPGVEVLPGRVADAEGRAGVAVSRTESGIRQELIFDPDSYVFLGWQMHEIGSGVESSQLRPYALLRIAVVDQARQLP